MGLRMKFNLVLVAIFVFGFGLTGWLSNRLLQGNARDEVLRHAGLMLESAIAVRSYTVGQVRPHLEAQMEREFLPQSVPAYAATETINELRKKHPDYVYKEATLNPTNLRDRATDWENDVVQAFRNNRDVKELVGERDTPTGRSLYIARPMEIESPACLVCHSVPSTAPASMIKRYGEENGFGWEMNEIVGAQIVSVPMSVPIQNADRAFRVFMISLFTVFVVLFVALNIMLSWVIVRPIQEMSKAADQVSTGDFDVEEFSGSGKDEVAVLATSFNRMRRSLHEAMKMLDTARE